MYSYRNVALILLIFFVFGISCEQKQTPQEEIKPVVEKIETICIWDGAALRAEPTSKGKWLSSISLGETVYWREESQIDTTDRDYEYLKIELSDGTVGWASKWVLVTDAKVGAVLDDTPIYKRPDLLTMTDEHLDMMDMVAITEEKGEWIAGNLFMLQA